MRGGAGNNIPCDLFNEHINKLLKYLIRNMGSNLTEFALQRAARSVTSLQQVCETFDVQSGVPWRTTAHSTRCDKDNFRKVVQTVLDNTLLVELDRRELRSFKDMRLNPLQKWDVAKTRSWFNTKIKEYQKYNGSFRCEVSENDIKRSPVGDVKPWLLLIPFLHTSSPLTSMCDSLSAINGYSSALNVPPLLLDVN